MLHISKMIIHLEEDKKMSAVKKSSVNGQLEEK